MKIVYLHQYFNTANSSGGTRSYEFARRLVKAGHEVHVVTSDRASLAQSKDWRSSDIDGIRVHAVPQPYDNSMNPAQRLKAFLSFALRASARGRSLKADVVFATSTPLTIAIPAIASTVGRRVPLVMEIRDLWPAVPIAMGYLKNPLVRFLASSLEILAYRRSSRIIALSEGMAEGIVSKGVDKSEVTVIPNLSDTARFRHAGITADAFYDDHPELEGRPFLVYTGTFGQVNGVEYMASLAKYYLDYDPNFAFVAMGSGAKKEYVRNFSRELGVLDRNFFLLDPVAKKDLPVVLHAAVACSSWVIPIKELEANSANKFFDALAAGRPMIINHGGWQRELLDSSEAGLSLPAQDFAAAAALLHEKLSDQEWVARASAASAKLGEDEFEVEKSFAKFSKVLETAARVE